MAEPPKPILFIAFANDVENPERNLGGLHGEFANIQAAFASVTGADDSCELLMNEACTGEGLVEPFYRNQVVIFHYAGHASPDSLLLQTSDGRNAPASRQRFEDFLAVQSRLRLVFLNACMTREWAAALVSHGVCVVATSRCIEDSIAPRFASVFYNQIAQGRTIADAFEVASRGCSSAGEHQESLRGFAAAENDHATDGLPWALYGSETARQWKLADDADDPTIGLPRLDPAKYPPPRDSPYVTIEGHQPADALIFFGRNAEIRRLWDWITTPTTTPVLLFYGQSGAGKSSLLRAGLQPRLDGIGKVQYARRGQDLSADLETAIGAAGGSEAGWLGSDQSSLIVLDQAEEAITQGAKGEMAALADRLGGLFANRRADSRARLILSFRKEYLAEIENLMKARLPDQTTHLFLETLSHKAIRQVVLGPVRSEATRNQYQLRISGDFAEFLANRLQNSKGSVATVLQIVLRRMWEEGRKQGETNGSGPIEFTQELYFRVIDDQNGPLQQFLSEQLNRLGECGWQGEVDGGLELDLLLEHTTDHVTARRRNYDELQAVYPGRDQLRKLLEENKRLHLLTEAQDDGADAKATTLSHDQLASVVRAEWNLSQLPGARARRIVENRARTWGESKRGDALDGADLKVVERGLEQMRALDSGTHEVELIEASRRRRRKRRQAWIVWPSVAAVVIGCVVAFAVANQTARDHIRQLTQNAQNSIGKDDFAALLLAMQAGVDARDSWVLRAAPNKQAAAEVQQALLNSLETYHEAGRYQFDYLNLKDDRDIGCAVSFDANDRLLLRVKLQYRPDSGDLEPPIFTWGSKTVPENLVAKSFPVICDTATGRVAGFQQDDSRAEVWQWQSNGNERATSLSSWPWDQQFLASMGISPDGQWAAFSSVADKHILLVNLDQRAGWLFDPGVGMPSDLAFSPDGSILAATGPNGMTWYGMPGYKKVELKCPGNYTLLRFAESGGHEFAAVRSGDPLQQRVEFWKLPLSANPDASRCQPFDYYEHSEDDRETLGHLSNITALAFDSSGTTLATGDEGGFVDLYSVPPQLVGSAAAGGSDSHHFPAPLAGPLPSMNEQMEQVGPEGPQVKGAVQLLGLSHDLSLYATEEDTDPQILVWPTDIGKIQSELQAPSTRKPLRMRELLSIACSELSVYLNDDAADRVNPAQGQGVDLHAIQAGCARLPKTASSAAH